MVVGRRPRGPPYYLGTHIPHAGTIRESRSKEATLSDKSQAWPGPYTNSQVTYSTTVSSWTTSRPDPKSPSNGPHPCTQFTHADIAGTKMEKEKKRKKRAREGIFWTPLYMAPKQCVALHLATGRRPTPSPLLLLPSLAGLHPAITAHLYPSTQSRAKCIIDLPPP